MIGIDIVEHARMNEKLATKILTQSEYDVYEQRNDKIAYLCSRFAAKEAIIKATNKAYLLSDIEILNDENGKPYTNISNIELSISHEKNYSVAVAINRNI